MRASTASLVGFTALLSVIAACSGSQFSSDGLAQSGTGGSTGSGGSSASGGANPGSGGAATGGTASGGASGSVSTGGGPSGGGSAGAGGASSGGASAGGSPDTGGAGGASAGGAGGGAVVDAGPPALTACPPTPPDAWVRCEGSFSCTYGDDPRPNCRPRYDCAGGGFLGVISVCQTLESCYSDVSPLPVIGKACGTLGEFCIWDSGLSCSCTPTCQNGSCTAVSTWNCAPAASSPCPLVAPNLGQPCESSVAVDCKYAACPIESALITTCKNGIWNWTIPVCN